MYHDRKVYIFRISRSVAFFQNIFSLLADKMFV